MPTPHEELLVAGVNARLEQRKRENRWWYVKQEDRSALLGPFIGFLTYPSFLLSRYLKDYLPPFILPIAFLVLFATWRIGKQQKTILRLEQRIKALEKGNGEN